MPKTIDDPFQPIRDLAQAVPQLQADLVRHSDDILRAHSLILRLEERVEALESVNLGLARALTITNAPMPAAPPKRGPGRPRKTAIWPPPAKLRAKR